MNIFSSFYPGERVVWLVVNILIQTTVVSSAALFLVMFLGRRRAALRHSVLVCAVGCMLLSPVLTAVVAKTQVEWVRLPVSRRLVAPWMPAQPGHVETDQSAFGPVGMAGTESGRSLLEDPFEEFATSPSGEMHSRVTRDSVPGLAAPGGGGHRVPIPVDPPSTSGNASGGRAAIGGLTSIWLAVCCLLHVRLWRGWREVSRLRRVARPIDESRLIRQLRTVMRQLGLRRRPSMASSPDIPGPLTVGLLQPVILLPPQLLDSINDRELRHLLLHECAHIKRHDCLAGIIQRFVSILYWPHPLVHLVGRELSKVREDICDNFVLLHGERTEYGRLLLQLAEAYSSRGTLTATSGLLSQRESLEQRIHGILDPGRILRTRTCGSLGMCLFSGFMVVVVGVAGVRLLITDPLLVARGDAAESPPSAQPAAERAEPITEEKRLEVPRIVSISPDVGATDVDPSTSQITVTFDRDMSRGYSWTGGGTDYPATPKDSRVVWRDPRTCVLTVKLQRGKFYRVGINSTSFQNFRSAAGTPARPAVIYFTTVGSNAETKNKIRIPQVKKLSPVNGATDVDPDREEIRVTFDLPMGTGFSWTGGGDDFPQIPTGSQPRWTADERTCILPVVLEENKHYELGLNSLSHQNFQSAAGVPLKPLIYTFQTRND